MLATDKPTVHSSGAEVWRGFSGELGARLAARAESHDASDAFVTENYVELKAYGAFSAAVPRDLGGGGASHREVCALIGEMAHSCGSTALALSMHTHLV